MERKKKDPRQALSKRTMQELETRTKLALEEKHALFRQEHQADSDEQLLEYVRQCAEAIGRSPCLEEVIGGEYIAERFGGKWSRALLAAGLSPMVQGVPPLNKRYIYKKEYKLQTKAHRREKQAKAEKKAEKRQKKNES